MGGCWRGGLYRNKQTVSKFPSFSAVHYTGVCYFVRVSEYTILKSSALEISKVTIKNYSALMLTRLANVYHNSLHLNNFSFEKYTQDIFFNKSSKFLLLEHNSFSKI